MNVNVCETETKAKQVKTCATKAHVCDCNKKAEQSYGYYSKLLQKPFDTIEELLAAEEEVQALKRAKEDKAAKKKADAVAVEKAFKQLNSSRKAYKDSINTITNSYREELTALRANFEKSVAAVKDNLSKAETEYKTALKTFADKYPEGYHLTLKDGDFETTVSSNTNKSTVKVPDIFDVFFDIFHF